jgi:hypothetical protein
MYLPATQSAHAVALADAEYLPAAHAAQSDIAALPVVARYVPAAQSWHVVTEMAALEVEYFPAGQPVQAADPVVLL